MLRDVREFLKAFSKNRNVPEAEYTVDAETADYPNTLCFYCECRIPDFGNIGVGESHSERHAEFRAAKHLCRQLRDVQIVGEAESAQLGLDEPDSPSDVETLPPTSQQTHSSIPNKKRPARSQAEVYGAGGWTLLNAKSRFNQYMQQTRQSKDINIYPMGPDHKMSFIAEVSLYVPSCGQYITIKEHGNTKKVAGNTCALSALSELVKMGAVVPYQSKEDKKLSLSRDIPDLTLPHNLVQRAEHLLTERGIELVTGCEETTDEPVSVITEKPQVGILPTSGYSQVIEWAEPNVNWNPWTGRPPLTQLHMGHPDGERERIESDILLEQLRSYNDTQLGISTMRNRQQLTISNLKDEILDLIANNQVVLIRGDTGSGKTTQVPQFILDSYIENGRGAECSIVVTQPRRISAIAVSERVAAERGERVGMSVGYSVRFDCVLPRQLGSILYCTTGILCRKLELGLHGISHLILDEIHERDINTDFLFVAIRDMVHTYPNFRVVLMSATVDTTIFSNYFDCPVVEVLGKMFSVQEYFLEDAIEFLEFHPPPSKIPPSDEDHLGDTNKNLECDRSIYKPSTCIAMAKMVEREISFELIECLLNYFSTLGLNGSVLIFLPGWNIIFALSQYLAENPNFSKENYLILLLHSSVPKEDQAKIFYPAQEGVTKVILATNIAETSITINDVVFVIDSAKAKIKHFTSHNNMTHYVTVWASKTNLEQRMGRAGRVQAGFCFHLCSKARYDALPQHMTPEILRSPLLDVVLNIKLLKLGDINSYLSRCVEPPTALAIQEAIYLLKVKNALDVEENITPLGSIVARLPLEPRIAYMLIMSILFGQGDTFTTITAAISFPEPYIIKGKRLSHRHRNLGRSKFSDHISLSNVYLNWLSMKLFSDEEADRFCNQFQLNRFALLMVHDAKQQLQRILMDQGFPEACFVSEPSDNTRITSALLCVGLYPNVAIIEEKRRLLLPERKHALIHKTSNLCPMMNGEEIHYPSPYFVFGEKLRTKTVAAKQLTMVEVIHLSLFGSNLITVVDDLATLDSWIDVKMPFRHAAIIGGLREAISDVLSKVAINPASVLDLSPADLELIQLITELTDMKTYPDDYHQEQPITNNRFFRGDRGRGRYPRRNHYGFQSTMPTPYDTMDTGEEGVYRGHPVRWNRSRGRYNPRGGHMRPNMHSRGRHSRRHNRYAGRRGRY